MSITSISLTLIAFIIGFLAPGDLRVDLFHFGAIVGLLSIVNCVVDSLFRLIPSGHSVKPSLLKRIVRYLLLHQHPVGGQVYEVGAEPK